jgi:hypothetical protein
MRRDLSENGLRLSAHIALQARTAERDRDVPSLGGNAVSESAPLARLEIPLDRGRVRRFVATRSQRPDEIGEFDAVSVLEGLPEAAKLRVALYLLETCRMAFRLESDAVYAANMRLLVSELFAGRKPLLPCATLGDRLILFRTKMPSDLGAVSRAISIGAASVRRAPFTPSIAEADKAGAEANAYLMLPHALAEPEATIILVGDGGIAIRQIGRRRALPTVFEYLGRDRADRRAEAGFILECLATREVDKFVSMELAREISALADERSAVRAAPRTAALDIRICAAAPSGVFFGGRLTDRYGLVRALKVCGPGFETQVAVEELFRLGRSADGHIDFLAFAACSAQPPRPGRFVITPRFSSSAMGSPAPAIAATTERAARDQILRALPRQAPTALIERIAAPALFRLDGHLPAALPDACDIVEIGTAPAQVGSSLIVPFGRERDVLMTLAGTIAADAALRDSELIFVLDQVSARRGAELALSYLWAAYGVPSRLVVLPHAVARQDSFTAGIAATTSESILMLGEGIVPNRLGWSEALLDELGADDRVAVCGGRILNADGSIWSTGLSLDDRPDASLCVKSEGAGMPEKEAVGAPSAVGASLGFCALRRAAWTAVAGERRPYLTEVWSDLDLCARFRRAGWTIGHAPMATALRIDRTRRPTGLGSENESRIDAYSFARWMAQEAPVRQETTSLSAAA